MNSFEVNFDRLVGLTHNYGGLSYGNMASMKNQSSASNPREAALQGLEKMKYLHSLGVKQAVLPPDDRPALAILQRLGYSGSAGEILNKAFDDSPHLLMACCSSASMWAANAATITPSTDSPDGKVHITPANLASKFHRSIEVPVTTKILQVIFNSEQLFNHHPFLPMSSQLGDEGAANHTRFSGTYDGQGFHLFVYGQNAFKPNAVLPQKFPARQMFEASQAIARRHQLSPNQVLFVQQNPQAIDAGVFHNDVISVGNLNVFLYHEKAFVATDSVIHEIQQRLNRYCYTDLIPIKVTEKEVSLKDAVDTYLFNSQIVQSPDGKIHLIAPTECQRLPQVRDTIDRIVASPDNPISKVHYLELRQSMFNGGGPACLRLRAILSPNEYKAVHKGVIFNDGLYEKLATWIKKHYREQLAIGDLTDPKLITESHTALDELTKILGLGSIYPFQK